MRMGAVRQEEVSRIFPRQATEDRKAQRRKEEPGFAGGRFEQGMSRPRLLPVIAQLWLFDFLPERYRRRGTLAPLREERKCRRPDSNRHGVAPGGF